MGILKEQAGRLLREEDWNPNDLAQEIYSILNSDDPITIDSPVQIRSNGNLPALQVTNQFNNGGGPAITINGTTTTNGPTVIGGPMFTFAYPPGTIVDASSPFNFDFTSPSFSGTSPASIQFPASDPAGSASTLTQVYLPETKKKTDGTDAKKQPFIPATPITYSTNPEGSGPVDGTPNSPDPGDPTATPDTGTDSGGGGLPPPSDWPSGMAALAAGNNGSYLGKVVSGEGSSHEVSIYPQGLNGAVGPTVTVHFPMLGDDQSITPGTVITGINRTVRSPNITDNAQGQVVEYWASIPVWMS